MNAVIECCGTDIAKLVITPVVTIDAYINFLSDGYQYEVEYIFGYLHQAQVFPCILIPSEAHTIMTARD